MRVEGRDLHSKDGATTHEWKTSAFVRMRVEDEMEHQIETNFRLTRNTAVNYIHFNHIPFAVNCYQATQYK